jgi:hypothetical protein
LRKTTSGNWSISFSSCSNDTQTHTSACI